VRESQTRRSAEAELARLRSERQAPRPAITDPTELAALGERVAAWLDPADAEKMRLALEGLELTVWAGAGEPRATGSLPLPATCEPHSRADVRSMVTKRSS
jgi:hypothetical protein